MFDVDEFVTTCRDALTEGSGAVLAVKEQIERATSRPAEIERAVGDLTAVPPFSTWYQSPELTILHVVWPPGVDLLAHDHQMWAAIGLYGGREDNRFFRRLPEGMIEPRGEGRTLQAGDSIALGEDTVHAVANPSREWTGSIHAYGGDYFAVERSMWSDPDSPGETFDADRVISVLEGAAAAARRDRNA